jgi:hypothetical protein
VQAAPQLSKGTPTTWWTCLSALSELLAHQLADFLAIEAPGNLGGHGLHHFTHLPWGQLAPPGAEPGNDLIHHRLHLLQRQGLRQVGLDHLRFSNFRCRPVRLSGFRLDAGRIPALCGFLLQQGRHLRVIELHG